MHIGRLDTLITLQSPSEVKSTTTGEVTLTWSDYMNVWARIDDQEGDEKTENNELVYVQKVNFLVRFDADINNRMRIILNNQIYEILSLQQVNINRKNALKLITVKRDNTS